MAKEDAYPTTLPFSSGEDVDNGPAVSSVVSRSPEMVDGSVLPAIMESVPVAILAVDGQFRVVVANKQARALFSVSADSCLGYSVRRFLSQDKLEAARRVLLARVGKHVYQDTLLLGDVEREVDVVAELLQTSGREFLCLSLDDRTNRDRERAEWNDSVGLEERPTEHLERAHHLEALGHLTGSLAHDFNNLLSVILGSLEAAQRRLKEQMDLSGDLERALIATRRSIQTTSQILRYSRNRDDQTEPLSPSGALLELRGLMERAVGNGVELIVETRETAPIHIGAAQLETSLLNLAINARDALPEKKGKVEFLVEGADYDESSAVTLGLVPGPYVVITVSDNGVGMSEELKERVFEPFFTTKPVGVGTGLGLSTVRAMVRRLGGAVALESEPGSGTSIRLIFPAAV